MFVCAMRNKGSEWRALSSFQKEGKLPFTPLIEAVCEPFIPGRFSATKSPIAEMRKLGHKVDALADSGRVWIDLANLLLVFSPNDVAELHREVRQVIALGRSRVTPVVRTSSPPEVIDAILEWAIEANCGLCIRIEGVEGLNQKAEIVNSLASKSELPDDRIDLIFDAQDLPRVNSYALLGKTFRLSQTARTWTVLAGSFPPSITPMSPDHYEHRLERAEWFVWQEEIADGLTGRLPQYGDYATQPAVYTPSPSFPGSPSVRYSTRDQFVVLRGRGGPSGKGTEFNQYIGHALYLTQQEYFCEVEDTLGDAYVRRIASTEGGTGNLTTWRVASLQRHVSVAVSQLREFTRIPAMR